MAVPLDRGQLSRRTLVGRFIPQSQCGIQLGCEKAVTLASDVSRKARYEVFPG